MKKGGYQIIDLSAYKFTNGESQIIKNIYNIIKNTKKVVIISGLTVDDTEYHDMFTVFIDYETFFCGLAQYEGNNICFVVTNDGSVVVNVSEVNKEPVAYLYNGTRRPPLPDWDKELYPYAVMWDDYLLFSTAELQYDAMFTERHLATTVDGSIIVYVYTSENTEWVRDESKDMNTTTSNAIFSTYTSKPLKWANYDVKRKSDGAVFLETSEPVPVYE